jgi:hypothetical protein
MTGSQVEKPALQMIPTLPPRMRHPLPRPIARGQNLIELALTFPFFLVMAFFVI